MNSTVSNLKILFDNSIMKGWILRPNYKIEMYIDLCQYHFSDWFKGWKKKSSDETPDNFNSYAKDQIEIDEIKVKILSNWNNRTSMLYYKDKLIDFYFKSLVNFRISIMRKEMRDY